LVLEILLFYLRHRYLAATECLLLLCLYEIADEAGCGYVNAASLAERLGRSRTRYQRYLKRLERHGLIETVRDRRRGGDFFRLESAVTDAARENGSPRRPKCDHAR
jgi:DNA-binding MarR family transcriptional regulator